MNRCSIIVPTFNRLEYLKKCLVSLLELDFKNYEIIIVNDGSVDGTKDFLDTIQSDKVRVIHHEQNRGVSITRNTGIKYAKYDILAFIDDDCVAQKNWLKKLLSGFVEEQTGLVIGQTFYIDRGYKGYFPERLVSNIGAKWPMSCNIAYRKKVFDICGGFDDRFFEYNNEDSEMAIRALSKDFLFTRESSAVVLHQKATWTVASLLRSAKNASVWPILKKMYPNHYLIFGPPVKFGLFVSPVDYLYLLTGPVFIPLLFIRYLINGKRDLKIFFIKWPVLLVLKRFFVYREAIRNRVWMF